MANILVLEPDSGIRALYERAISRLGHRAWIVPAATSVDASRVDAVVVEPGSTSAMSVVRELLAARPALPIVCASIYPADYVFGLEPVAFLLKPFSLDALARALEVAVAVGRPAPVRPV